MPQKEYNESNHNYKDFITTMNLETIIHKAKSSNIKWTLHAAERLRERGLRRNDIIHGICHGEILEEYPDDYPHPSCLIFGHTADDRTLHIVVGMDDNDIYIITAYIPTLLKFEPDLKTRRPQNE